MVKILPLQSDQNVAFAGERDPQRGKSVSPRPPRLPPAGAKSMYEDELYDLIFPLRFAAAVDGYAVDELLDEALNAYDEEPLGRRGVALAVILAYILRFGHMPVDVDIRMLRSPDGEPKGVALAVRWPEGTAQSEALAALNAEPRLELHIASERLARVLSVLEQRPLGDKVSISTIAEIWREKPEKAQESIAQDDDAFQTGANEDALFD
jgi:hypothetical protein